MSARTLAELARKLGVSKQAACKWSQRPDWPFSRRGPFDVEQVREWRSAALEQPPQSATAAAPAASPPPADPTAALRKIGPERLAKLLIAQERQAILKLQRQKLAGELVSRVDVEREWLAKVVAVRDELLAMGRILAPQIVDAITDGDNELQVEQIIDMQARSILDRFAAHSNNGKAPSETSPKHETPAPAPRPRRRVSRRAADDGPRAADRRRDRPARR